MGLAEGHIPLCPPGAWFEQIQIHQRQTRSSTKCLDALWAHSAGYFTDHGKSLFGGSGVSHSLQFGWGVPAGHCQYYGKLGAVFLQNVFFSNVSWGWKMPNYLFSWQSIAFYIFHVHNHRINANAFFIKTRKCCNFASCMVGNELNDEYAYSIPHLYATLVP